MSQRYLDARQQHLGDESHDSAPERKCYACGSTEHIVAKCHLSHLKQQRKCFSCNEYGHIAKQCTINVVKYDCHPPTREGQQEDTMNEPAAYQHKQQDVKQKTVLEGAVSLQSDDRLESNMTVTEKQQYISIQDNDSVGKIKQAEVAIPQHTRRDLSVLQGCDGCRKMYKDHKLKWYHTQNSRIYDPFQRWTSVNDHYF